MIVDKLTAALGAADVMTGADMAPWMQDWTGAYRWQPLCVARPRDTEGVAQVMRLARAEGVAVVPVGGNTGLVGGTVAEGAVMLSLDRMNRVTEIRPEARLAVVEAGVVLEDLHSAVAAQGLRFPMTFGAKGSATLGGMMSTNAGGSNVLRYGNTRDLVLGLEAVLPSGEVMDLMGALHKDNSGLSLKHLMIGAEGTLGVITRAVVKLVPEPRAYATALLSVPSLPDALRLLHQLQEASDGAVEAFEYMDLGYTRAHDAHKGCAPVFDPLPEVMILVELAATAPRDSTPREDGSVPLTALLEEALAEGFEAGLVTDAVVAHTDAQRRQLWARREAAAEITVSRLPVLICDIAVALDHVSTFLDRMALRLPQIDPGAEATTVSHLGDGNLHYSVWPSDAALKDPLMEAVEDEVRALSGSFSAEHGIGLGKLPSMARRKDPAALAAMRAIKQALDPDDLMNPGKLYPG